MLVTIINIKHKPYEQPELSYIAGSNAKNDIATLENVYQFLIKLNIDLTHNPAIQHPGIYPSEMKTCSHRNLHIAVLFTISKSWKQSKYPPTKEWINKWWYIYRVEHRSSRRNELLIHAMIWMKHKYIMLREGSQTQKVTHIV